jgi:hypothetical protein
MAQGHLFCALWPIHHKIPGADLQYKWVKSHQDAYMPWRCLSLEEQLNTACNTFLKSAVTCAITLHSQQIGPVLFPFECMAMVVEGIKIVSQVASPIRFAFGKSAARQLNTKAIN